MKKWLALSLLAVVLLFGYLAAGPFLAYNAIREAVKAQDTAELAEHVDFPALRGNLRLQVDDYMVRKAGADAQSSLLGAFAVRIASGIAGGAVDTMVTPAGIGALLEGRTIWHRVSGGGITANTYEHAPPRDRMHDPSYGFESLSRFTATVESEDGDPLTLVLSRQGLVWKLTDIRLPLGGRAEQM